MGALAPYQPPDPTSHCWLLSILHFCNLLPRIWNRKKWSFRNVSRFAKKVDLRLDFVG